MIFIRLKTLPSFLLYGMLHVTQYVCGVPVIDYPCQQLYYKECTLTFVMCRSNVHSSCTSHAINVHSSSYLSYSQCVVVTPLHNSTIIILLFQSTSFYCYTLFMVIVNIFLALLSFEKKQTNILKSMCGNLAT